MATDDEKQEEVCKILLSLLLARQGATPVTVLDRDYYEIESERIPWRKFGHSSLVDFLKSVPQKFLVESYNGGHYVRGIASDKSRHVSSLVARQKSKILPSHTRSHRPFMRYIPQQRMRSKVPPNCLHYLVQYIKNNPDGVSMQHIREQLEKQLPSMTISVQDLRMQLYELSHQLRIDGEIIYPVQVNNTLQDVKNCKQPPSLMPELQNASCLTSIEMCAGDEESDYLDLANQKNFIPAGCMSNNYSKPSKVHGRLAANFMQNTQSSEQNTKFYYDNNNDVDINKYFIAKNDSIDEETINDNEYMGICSLISQRTKSRLKHLIEKHPEGIWCADLPDMFLKEYNVHLNYIDLGFTSVREYASYLTDIFYMTQENMKDDFLLYSIDKKPTVPTKTCKSNPAEREANFYERQDDYRVRVQLDDDDDDNLPIPADVSPDITKRFAPANVMNYNDSVDCILVTHLLAKMKSLKAYVIEVFNPSFFWIQLWENKKLFENFMKDLTDFYKYNDDQYIIPKIALKKGLNCACIYANMWHRGIIKSVKPDYRVTVLFYDFGTLKTYAPEDVYYLHKKFSSLPAQAIPCGLYNVKPIQGDRWKKSVNNQFIDRIDGHNGLLGVTIKSIDPLNNSMMVVLTDINEDGETDINEWLVKEKLAKHGKMGDAVDMASLMKYVNNNFNQLPSYCFAEENLITDRCQATSTEEIHAVPLISPKETLRDNNTQTPSVRSSVRLPPGFTSVGEQTGLLEKPINVCNGSSGNMPNERMPAFGDAEATTNPFLYDQQFDVIPNHIAKSLFIQMWNENLQLQLKLTEMFSEMLEYTPLSRVVFNNHMKVQYQLNKIMKNFKKAMTLNNEWFLKSSFNPSKEVTPNDVGLSQEAINLNNEGDQNIANDANIYSLNVDAQMCCSQSSQFNPHVQVPSSTTASSMFSNCQSAGSSFSNINQESDNVSTRLTNSSLSNSDRAPLDFLGYKNNEHANIINETNPFKLYMTGNMEMPKTPESQQTAASCDSDSGYLSGQSLQNQISKIATSNVDVNFHVIDNVIDNNFASAGHVNINGNENYSSKIVYEAGPVIYNTQKQQANADMRQNTCTNNLVPQNVSVNLGRDATQLLSSSVNNVTSHLKQNDILCNNEDCTTQSSIECMSQGLSSIINEELKYYQQDQANIPRPVSARAWKQVEIPKHWINSKFQNNVCLQDCKENCTAGMLVNPLSFQDWNFQDYNNIKKSAFPNINLHAFNSSNKENLMDVNIHPWNTPYNSISNTGNIFVFQKIDSVENVSFIFHVDQEGWILVHEFIETFTNFKVCIKNFAVLLETMNIKISFKEIERSKYPMQFSQLDSFPLNIPRDSEKRINSISLISLQTILLVLLKLKIISREEIDNVLKSNKFRDDSILRKIATLLVTYRDLKRRIGHYVNENIIS